MGRTFTHFLTLVVLCGGIGCSSRNTVRETPPTYGEMAQFRSDRQAYREAIDYNDALRAWLAPYQCDLPPVEGRDFTHHGPNPYARPKDPLFGSDRDVDKLGSCLSTLENQNRTLAELAQRIRTMRLDPRDPSTRAIVTKLPNGEWKYEFILRNPTQRGGTEMLVGRTGASQQGPDSRIHGEMSYEKMREIGPLDLGKTQELMNGGNR